MIGAFASPAVTSPTERSATVSGDRDLEIGLATIADVPGILEVQEQNLPEHGGSLSARFPAAWFERAIADGALIVARSAGRVAGYVAFTSRAAQEHVPVVQAMLRAHPSPDAYLHGPICVGADFRGRGVAAAMFAAQREAMGHADVIAFIREDNEPSRRAYAAMGMREVARFEHDGSAFVVVEAAG